MVFVDDVEIGSLRTTKKKENERWSFVRVDLAGEKCDHIRVVAAVDPVIGVVEGHCTVRIDTETKQPMASFQRIAQ